jgi:aspartyl protease family protein
MTTDQSMQLLYLVLLGGVVGGYFLLANRRRMGRLLQMAAIWFFIFVGMVLVVGLWEDVTRTALPRQDVMIEDGAAVIEVPRQRDGHYHMTLAVNGAPIRFIVDTGASDLVLSRDDAVRAGLDPDGLRYFGRAYTANGEVRTAQVRLDEVRVGDMVDTAVPAVVNQGDMRVSLLGMSYLQEFGRIEIANDTLRLIR